MNLSKISTFKNFSNYSQAAKFRKLFREMSSAAAVSEEIKIPNRIERSPTDILRALADTVQKDYTAPHYRYMDDPWLMPFTQSDKREFLFAKENGRSAARFIMESHPHLFTKNRVEAEPPITAFQPRAKYNRDNVTIELLENMVENFQVGDAVTIYDLLEKKGKDIEENLLQSLLELLAFHTEEEPLNETNVDLKMALPADASHWEVGGLAEILYAKLGTAEARLAMLMGLARHNKNTMALQMWSDMAANNDPIPLEGFNAYISVLSIEDVEKMKAEISSVLSRILEEGLVPNHETLVSCLQTNAFTGSKHMGSYAGCCKFALTLMSEFKSLGVEPGLGAYFQILQTYHSKMSTQRTLILKDILDLLEGKEMWPATSTQDFNFFYKAMLVARNLNQSKLALRLQSLLLTGNNLNLLGNAWDSDGYHMCLMMVVLRNEELDTTMEIYNQLTPHTWSPHKDFFMDLLSEINNKSAVHYLGKIFDDLELTDHGGSNKEGMYQMNCQVLRCLIAHPTSKSQYNNLSSTYIDISQRIFNHLDQNKASKGLYLRWNTSAADICSMAMKVQLREGQFEFACKVLEFCAEESGRMPGQLDEDSLVALVEAAVLEENTEVGMKVVDYMLGMGSKKSMDVALKLTAIGLSEADKRTLNVLFKLENKWVDL